MKKSLFLLISALIISGLSTLSGCKKDKGNGSSNMSFQFHLHDSGTPSSTLSLPGLTWNYAILNVSQFKVSLRKSNNEVWANKFEGLWDFNLLTRQDEFWNAEFPSGVKFDEISIQLKMTPSETKPPLVLKATWETPEEQIPVELYFNDLSQLNIKVNNLNINTSNYISVIHFEINELLKGIDPNLIKNATRTKGKIRICDCYNLELYTKIKAALNGSYTLTVE